MSEIYTIEQICEAGHRHTMVFRDVYTRHGAEMFAKILDGSLNPDAQERLRSINDTRMRVGRCNLVFKEGGEPACDAWITCTVFDGEPVKADTTFSPTEGGIKFEAKLPTRE